MVFVDLDHQYWVKVCDDMRSMPQTIVMHFHLLFKKSFPYFPLYVLFWGSSTKGLLGAFSSPSLNVYLTSVLLKVLVTQLAYSLYDLNLAVMPMRSTGCCTCMLHTFVTKWTFYLQKVEAPKVTLGILFWILNEHSVQEKKNKVPFLFMFLENTCFVCNSRGKWAHWGCYNLYSEALKGLLLKNAP